MTRVLPYGMSGHVALMRTDVSEEHIAFIIRVTRIGDPSSSILVTLVIFLQNIGPYKSHMA
jgi:hypothetical protein